jgi:hypothetical protein
VSARCTVVRWSTITAARVCCVVLYSAAERGTLDSHGGVRLGWVR